MSADPNTNLSEGSLPSNSSTVDVQQLYVNGFSLTASLSDLNLTTMIDGVPHTQFHMSFTTGKTLMIELQSAISQIEELTGNEIMPMETFKKAYETRSK